MPTWKGIIPPLVTPLCGPDHLDVAGLERLVEHVIDGGVQGLFILGTTGEAPSLGYRLRRELIARACALTSGRLPVLVGITDTAFIESIALADVAAEAGAAAVVLSTPYYFPAGQTELISYVRHIAQHLSLPLMLYNMPSLTKVWFEYDTLQQLAAIDILQGIKDSSGDLAYFERLMQLRTIRPDWAILMGPESLLPQAIALGGDGVVAGGANVCPSLFVECYRAAVAGDSPRLADLHRRILRFQQIYDVGKYASRFIKATKCALSLLGVCDDFMAEPFHHFHTPERQRVRAILEELRIGPLEAAG